MADIGRQDLANKLIVLLSNVGADFLQRGKINGFEINQGHDVHAFYSIVGRQRQAIHVQGYPGPSTEREGVVLARLMDYDKMMEIRRRGCSIGNEHDAVIQEFPNLRSLTNVPYDTRILEGMLAENIPQLK